MHAKINYSNQTFSLMTQQHNYWNHYSGKARHCLNWRGAMHIYRALKLQVSLSHWQTAREPASDNADRSESKVQVVTSGIMLLIIPSNMRPRTKKYFVNWQKNSHSNQLRARDYRRPLDFMFPKKPLITAILTLLTTGKWNGPFRSHATEWVGTRTRITGRLMFVKWFSKS